MDYAEIKRRLADKLRRDEALLASVSERLAGGAGRALDAPEAEVAIVGAHCRFPGGDSPLEYYESLLAGRESLSVPDTSRWLPGAGDEIRSLRFGRVERALDFDCKALRISPREAEAMDPHHRVLLESALACIEDAGHDPGDLAGTRTGVFVAMYNQDFAHFSRRAAWEPESLLYVGTGNAHAMLPNRLSYLFDLRGPSEIVDTACSSSLVAIHRATQAILGGECDRAIVGAASLLLDPERLVALKRIGVLSPDGRCALFDAGSKGQVMGEGVASILLERSSETSARRGHTYALVRGTGVNHRGRRTPGLLRPDAEAMVALIDDVYRRARLSPRDVAYVEAHGNGGAGDAVELQAFQERFAPGTSVGSAKANIGCLEAAGGLAQVLKVLLAIRHGVMPPTLHHRELPQGAGLVPGACRVLVESAPLGDLRRHPDTPFLAGVHAYGIGGVNAHVVLQAPPADERAPTSGWVPLLLSGARAGAVKSTAVALLAQLSRSERAPLADIGFTLAVGRERRARRLAVIARTPAGARAALEAAIASFGEGRGDGGEPFVAVEDQGPAGPPPDDLLRDVRRWLAAGDGEIDWDVHFQGARRTSVPGTPLSRMTLDLPRGPEPSAGAPRAEAKVVIRTGQATSVEAFLASWLGRQCKVDPSSIPLEAPLADVGVDSVVLGELGAAVHRALEVALVPSEIPADASIATLAAMIRRRAGDASAAAGEALWSSLPVVPETDVRAVRSIAARDRLFQEELRALDAGLREPSPPALREALARHARWLEAREDAGGNLWFFIDTGPGNTFDLPGLRALAGVAEAVRDHADFSRTRVLHFTHRGRHFSLGGDRASFVEAVKSGDAEAISGVAAAYRQFLTVLQALPVLTVGVAYGSAQGGGMELLMALDHQIVWPGIKVGFPEIRSGLIAGMGGVTYASTIVGPQRAMALNTSGALLTGDEAAALGLVSQVSEHPFAAALSLAERARPFEAALKIRQIVNRGKYPLLLADVDAWIAFVREGHLLASEGKIREDVRTMGGSP